MHLSIIITAALSLVLAAGCGDDASRSKRLMSSKSIESGKSGKSGQSAIQVIELPSFIPLRGRPLPGHGGRPADKDSAVRKLTTRELVDIAYAFHPQMGDPDDYTIEAWDHALWNAPEMVALLRVQRDAYQRLPVWRALCQTVRQSIPPVYTVADRTYPRYHPAYVIVVDAPMEPGSKEERFLVVHLSYLVPYYTYYELHSRRVPVETRPDWIAGYSAEHVEWLRKLGGFIERDPWRYQVTPVFEPVLRAIEREIEARWGYWYLPPEIAMTPVPGIEVNGFHGHPEPPTLQDALFTPQRW